MHTEIIIVGAGGHASVVLDALKLNTFSSKIRVVDADKNKIGITVLDCIVQGIPKWGSLSKSCIHVAIGSNSVRAEVARDIIGYGHELISVIHKKSSVSPWSDVGVGSFIAASSVVGARAKLGSGVIVNHGAVVDHDCLIGEFSHVAPNATLGGGCRVGQNVLIGAGATLLPEVTIGDDIVIGAGAVVTNDLQGAGGTYIGVPAKRVYNEKD